MNQVIDRIVQKNNALWELLHTDVEKNRERALELLAIMLSGTADNQTGSKS